ncbi:MAG: hypothetical protein EHM35_09675 [Planctomycetaceae bacterium]|nr:MAG: hypothetical protein EHM35_09675 [Planctomycetaceae bacterium]
MILPGFVRKLSAVFRGNVAPPLIFLSVLMGAWMGMMPGWSGLHTVLVVIVLVVNLNLGLFILSLGAAKALSLAAAPVLYHTGIWVHGHAPGVLATLSSIPVIGLTDYSRFALVGGLVLGPIVGAVAGIAMALIVINFRRMMVKLDEKSEKFRRYYSKFWVRFLDWLIIGKRTRDVKSMFAKAKFVRKVGVALAVLLVGGFLVAAHFLQGTMIKQYTAKTLTNANKAQVDIGDLGLSVLGGNAHVTGLQFTDPQQPQQNQLAIEKVEADANMRDLLIGRMVMENVTISEVRFNQARQTPGTVLPAPADANKPFDPCDYGVTAENLGKLEKYVKDIKKVKEQLRKLREWLPDSNEAGEDEVAAEKKPENYLEYLTARAKELPSPRVLAKKVLADKVVIPSELFKNSQILVTNLNDAPKAAGLPITLEMKSYETPAAMKVALDYSKPGSAPEVSGTFEGFDLSTMQSSLSPDAGIAFQSGKASGTFTGQLTRDQVDLTINLNLKDLQAQGTGKGVLGLGAEQTSEVMAVLKELTTTIRVVGPTADPRLVFDTKGLTEEFKQALLKAGKDRAASELNKQIEKQLGDKVPTELKDTLKKPATNIVEGLGGLLGGKKKEEKKQ